MVCRLLFSQKTYMAHHSRQNVKQQTSQIKLHGSDVWALGYNFQSYSFILKATISETIHINELHLDSISARLGIHQPMVSDVYKQHQLKG